MSEFVVHTITGEMVKLESTAVTSVHRVQDHSFITSKHAKVECRESFERVIHLIAAANFGKEQKKDESS